MRSCWSSPSISINRESMNLDLLLHIPTKAHYNSKQSGKISAVKEDVSRYINRPLSRWWGPQATSFTSLPYKQPHHHNRLLNHQPFHTTKHPSLETNDVRSNPPQNHFLHYAHGSYHDDQKDDHRRSLTSRSCKSSFIPCPGQNPWKYSAFTVKTDRRYLDPGLLSWRPCSSRCLPSYRYRRCHVLWRYIQ